jgi:DNA modification methylase
VLTDPFFFPSQGNQSRQGSATYYITECKEFLRNQKKAGVLYDAVVTDPPYEIGYMGKEWDSQGIAFSTEFWSLVYDVMKPGAFLGSFAAQRMYHRVAVAVEDAGFRIYPFLTWNFQLGLQKPVNVSELFDRDNVPDRKPIGWKNGSGYTTAKVKHGVQNLTKNKFPIYERDVSDEAKEWSGYFYGLNSFKPMSEPIVLAQKPVVHDRVIDNIREYRTGALNMKGLEKRTGSWPTTILSHDKAKKKDHGSDHPSVKPVPLMEDLCVLLCPTGGHILDPFGGTGTTAQAAVQTGFSCTITEQNPEMESVIRNRLKL